MKKIIIFSAIISLFCVSCNSDEDLFDQSSGERIEVIWTDVEQILNQAPNGWSMEFYYDETLSYGGIQMLMRFEDGFVEITSENEESDFTDRSTYSYAHDGGASINFDTYNDALHRYSEPSSSNTAGMGGDFEFIIVSYSSEKIVLTGKRNGVTYTLTPLADERSWSDIMDDYKALVEEMSKLSSYTFVVDGLQYEMELDSDRTQQNRRLLYTDPFGDGSVEIVPFVYTFTGIKFYEPLDFDGIIVEEMEWNGKKFIDAETGAVLG